MIDTGNPISFIKIKNFERFFGVGVETLHVPTTNFRSINNSRIPIKGTITSSCKLEKLDGRSLEINFHVVEEDSFVCDLIFGRDFLLAANVTLIYDPARKGGFDNIELFSHVSLHIKEFQKQEAPDEIVDEIATDLDVLTKQRLKNLLLNIENLEISICEDDYCVTVNLKDSSIYAYAPRRFALTERKKIRQITDDLLNRGIIKPSNSPYACCTYREKKW